MLLLSAMTASSGFSMYPSVSPSVELKTLLVRILYLHFCQTPASIPSTTSLTFQSLFQSPKHHIKMGANHTVRLRVFFLGVWGGEPAHAAKPMDRMGGNAIGWLSKAIRG